MKYMGSKVSLLNRELGHILMDNLTESDRFVDLFSGSGAVSHFVAQRADIPVLSVDLQEYARVLSAAVIERTSNVKNEKALNYWIDLLNEVDDGPSLVDEPLTTEKVMAERYKAESVSEGFICKHYGGYYYSYTQAKTFDLLYENLPFDEPSRTVALSAILQAASICAASPGHTAQPFQPTNSLLPYINQAWRRDVSDVVSNILSNLSVTYAQKQGKAVRGNAQDVISSLDEKDLVFCDPPYSALQYSRFYHVLEGIARGGWDEVLGQGRAPSLSMRRSSNFSMKSKAAQAIEKMLEKLHKQGCKTIITFPDANASNGLSGKEIIRIAEPTWSIKTHFLESTHSTLGGNGGKRAARKNIRETVLILIPKPVVLF